LNRTIAATAVLIAFAACTEEEQAPAMSFELRPIESFESPQWTGKMAADDPVVATVAGTPITLSMLRTQVERAGEEADPEAILNRMIELELLAREAFDAGKYTDQVVGQAMRQALAYAWITDQFERKISPTDIPRKYRELAFRHMRNRFDHFERFVLHDVQILCCVQDDKDSCYSDMFEDVEERREHLKSCFEYHEPEAQKLRAMLAEAKTLAEFREKYLVGSMDIPSAALSEQYHTSSKIQDYDFQYDVDSTYEEQFESDRKITYRVFHKGVMEGVKAAWLANGKKAPFVTPVLRTSLGFHIIFASEFHPEQHWGLDHPEVVKEVEANAFNPWRQIYFNELVEKLCAEVGCVIDHQRLVPLQEAQDRR